MESSATSPSPSSLWNVPNRLSAARIVLAVALFIVWSFNLYGWALALFLLASATDWLDGYWARKYGQVTQLGRMLDPFADKLLICGAFIFAITTPHSPVAAWMAVVIMGREILVTALRSFVEQSGGDFSAKWAGKLKMVFQIIAIGLVLFNAACDESAMPSLITTAMVAAWIAIASTLYSGWGYVRGAIAMTNES